MPAKLNQFVNPTALHWLRFGFILNNGVNRGHKIMFQAAHYKNVIAVGHAGEIT